MLSLLRPVMEPSAREVEAHAPADYHGLGTHPGLEKADQLYFSKMYLHLLNRQRVAVEVIARALSLNEDAIIRIIGDE